MPATAWECDGLGGPQWSSYDTDRGGLDVDVADSEESSNDVAVNVGVDDEQRREHDRCVAGTVLPPDVAHSRLQQRLHDRHVALRHCVVQRRVALTTRTVHSYSQGGANVHPRGSAGGRRRRPSPVASA